MREDVTLLDRAKIDLESCKISMERSESDELFIDAAAYQIQQAIEKLLKFWMVTIGVDYPRTHDMNVLIGILQKENQEIPEWLTINRNNINLYASQSRYGSSIVGVKMVIDDLISGAEGLISKLEVNKIPNAEIPECACHL
jgi:HEPN domain-containing protein